MPKPLKEYVQQVLGEHKRGQKIMQAMEHAAVVVNAHPENGTWRRKATRRHIFWEAAVDKLVELLAGDRGVHIVEHFDTVSFVFDDAVLVRLKKADISLHTSNYPTPQAELFNDHTADLFGFTGLQRVEAVYIPNRFDTGIVWTGIVAHDNDNLLWHFELTETVAAPVIALPAVPKPIPADLAKIKKPVKDADRKKKDGDR